MKRMVGKEWRLYWECGRESSILH